MPLAEGCELERLAGLGHQFEFVPDRGDVEIGVGAREIGQIDLLRGAGLGATAFEQADAAIGDVVGADEIAAAADRPGHRRGVERQRLLDFVEQIEGVAALAVHLVDEGDDGDVAQAADLEQLSRARLDALRGVDHHDGGIDRGQRAIGVFGEVLVAGRVQKIEDEALEFEGHHRGDDRNAALALDLHPVGAGVAPLALGLDLAGEIDGAAEQQQLLGQRGLAGVGVGDDGKGAPARHFVCERRAGRRFSRESDVGHGAKRLAGKAGQFKSDRVDSDIGTRHRFSARQAHYRSNETAHQASAATSAAAGIVMTQA